MQPVQLFRPGRYTAMSGQALDFSERDLRAAADAYDPALGETPIVAAHLRHEAIAYHWIESLGPGVGLEALPRQVAPAFAKHVQAVDLVLASMPEVLQRAAVAYYVEERSIRETAAKLSIGRAMAERMIERARCFVAGRLEIVDAA